MKHDDMIMWLVKLIFDSTVNSALRWCALSTEKRKKSRPLINNSSVLETKTSSQLQENAWVCTGSFFMVTWHRALTSTKGWDFPWLQPCSPTFIRQRFLIFFLFCIIFVPLQPPKKRINHTTIINSAGQRVLVVGVVLAEGTSGPSPTVLQFTVNIPKTGFFNFILRYKVRWQSRLGCVFTTTAHKCTLSSDRMIDLPFTCTALIKQPPKMGRFNGCLREFIHRGSLPLKDFLKHIYILEETHYMQFLIYDMCIFMLSLNNLCILWIV